MNLRMLQLGLLAITAVSIIFLGWFGRREMLNSTVMWSWAAAIECEHPLVHVARKSSVITESETVELVLVMNAYGNTPSERRRPLSKDCTATVEVMSPRFDREPSGASRSFTLPADGRNVSATWLLAPKGVGQHQVRFQSGMDVLTVPYTVITSLGLSAFGLALCAGISGLAAFLLLLLTLRKAVREWWQERGGRL